MSPKAIQYRANSIIFFQGDVSDKIFILNRGRVSLNYIDIETGQDIHEIVKVGEFFAVKSAMGRYPREETALSLQDSTVITFTVPEFEQFVSQNTRIIMKMLKVFSNQLRRNHKRVDNLLISDEQVSPEVGLYNIGEHYLKSRQYSQAIYAFGRYLVYYPSGQLSVEATKNLSLAEEHLNKYGQGKGPAPDIPGHTQSFEKPKPKTSREMSETAKEYYDAVGLVTEEKYREALEKFNTIVEKDYDEEYTLKARYEIGRCHFFLGRYVECIRIFRELVQKYPKHPDLNDALFFVARSNEQQGDLDKAEGLYTKVLSATRESDSLHSKAAKALRALQRKK